MTQQQQTKMAKKKMDPLYQKYEGADYMGTPKDNRSGEFKPEVRPHKKVRPGTVKELMASGNFKGQKKESPKSTPKTSLKKVQASVKKTMGYK